MAIPKFKPLENLGGGGKKATKGVLIGLLALLLGAFGLEASNNDWDLGKLLSGSSMEEAKVRRDKEGNVVTSGGKYTDEYNCDDFTTQPEAQRFFEKAGGVSGDTNRLDGDKDGVACESLPAGNGTEDRVVSVCTKASYVCADFKYQEDAQEVFDNCKDQNVAGLDGNKDVVVCESLPSNKEK